MATKMAARRSVCMCGHLTWSFVAYFLLNFYIWTTFIKLLIMSEYGLCPMNDNQDGLQNGVSLFSQSPTVLVMHARFISDLTHICDKDHS